MKRFYLVGFLVLMAFDTLAQLSFKKAGDAALPLEFSPSWLWRVFAQPWIYGALIGYIGAFFTWMHLLRRAPVGPAFAASHLEIISVLVLSHYLFQETIGLPQILGCMFIVAGIACLALSEARDHDAAKPAENPVDGTGASAAAR
ncbi:EamA family transporter [Comamonas sp.]|uniref:EamA family transporter n=1 Tax=Comamonas sp. TaxID=34028 RepID=UPI0028AC5E65|nr:EamA family transporter [Comamonas sp.]